MRTFKTLFLTLLFVAFGAAASSAQDSSTTQAESTLTAEALATTLADHESEVDRQRAELTELLSREDVRKAAQDRGIEMGEVESAAAGMTDAQVRTVAPLVAAVAQDNSGLGSITIGVGALILILLILILVT